MGTVIVNGVEVEVGPKDNVVLAARKAGVEIPHYCWHSELSVVASCRMCLVEVGEKKPDGTIVMGPKLVPACQTPAKPGTVVNTQSQKVKTSQAQTLEFLLLNHPLDCSICDQAGECYLQDYTFKYGRAQSRLDEPKVQREDKYHIGDQIALFTDRCVMCTRCVRFTREVSGTAELQVINRGSVEEIDVFPGEECNNKLAGNVVDLCPVGALCSKDFLYKKRVWWLKSQDSVCTGCSTGCSIKIDQNENHVYRLLPRENPLAQGHFMCDDGRFGFKYIESEKRLTSPRIGSTSSTPNVGSPSNGHSGNGSTAAPDLAVSDPWPKVLDAVRTRVSEAAKSGGKILGLFSPFMTVEEAYLLAKFLKSNSTSAVLVLGPVPTIGEDDRYPKGPKGEAPALEKTRFTIRAEKAPNRLGVEAVLEKFEGKVIRFEAASKLLSDDAYAVAFVVGGYPSKWVDDSILRTFSRVKTLIVQDLLASALTDRADIVLASGSFAEREGTVVNHAKLAQAIKVAVRAPGDARPDGRILSELNQRVGLFNAAALRKEIAKEIASLAALEVGDLGEHGVSLVASPVPQVAATV